MKNFFYLILILSIYSCSKAEKVNKAHPEMIGNWVHHSEDGGFHILYIQENGRGTQWGENNHGNTVDTQAHGWFIKEDVLHFTRWRNSSTEDVFIINQYPLQAGSVIYTSIRYHTCGHTIYDSQW